jgi:hypothetical protein
VDNFSKANFFLGSYILLCQFSLRRFNGWVDFSFEFEFFKILFSRVLLCDDDFIWGRDDGCVI